LWEYYGEGVLGKIQAWIFRSRIKVLMRFLRKARLDPGMILDVGCGPMFISYALISNEILLSASMCLNISANQWRLL
jgi:cyclopropane fatty-acyl-phospholipid synthase-like methyltransferase